MRESRYSAAAAVHNGQIYVVGGWNDKYLDTVEMCAFKIKLTLYLQFYT